VLARIIITLFLQLIEAMEWNKYIRIKVKDDKEKLGGRFLHKI